MAKKTTSLPGKLKPFVDGRNKAGGYGTSGEYKRELIRRDKDGMQFRQYLVDGINAKPAGPMNATYFDSLRASAENLQPKVK